MFEANVNCKFIFTTVLTVGLNVGKEEGAGDGIRMQAASVEKVQLMQLVAPELGWYWPEAQLVHAVEPCANETVPAKQAVQLDAPGEAW